MEKRKKAIFGLINKNTEGSKKNLAIFTNTIRQDTYIATVLYNEYLMSTGIIKFKKLNVKKKIAIPKVHVPIEDNLKKKTKKSSYRYRTYD